MAIAELAFWVALAFVTYTYVGYPVLVWLASRPRKVVLGEIDPGQALPKVTAVIAAFNEEGRIGGKLQNLLDLDYPSERLSIIVVSDGSTDGTAEKVRQFPKVRLVEQGIQCGKAAALNTALPLVDSPVVLLCDVRQRLEPRALRYLVATLQLPGVGAVGGQLRFEDPVTREASAVGLYWRYESWIRASESRLHSSVGLTGALYVVRTSLFPKFARTTVADDLEAPLAIVGSGHRAIVDHRAVAVDQLQSEVAGEFRRKARTLTGNYAAVANNPGLLNPLKNPVWLQFMSHKLFRLLVPYALIVILVTAMYLADHWFYRLAAILQLMLYGLALAPNVLSSMRSNPVASVARTFLVLNAAAVLALLNYVFGPSVGRWEKTS